MATTFAHFAPFEFFETGAPRATKTIDLGRDKMTVIMYSQNFIPVQENSGLAKSIHKALVSFTAIETNQLTWRNNAVSNDQYSPKSSFLGNSGNGCPPDFRCNLFVDPPGEAVFEHEAFMKSIISSCQLINTKETYKHPASPKMAPAHAIPMATPRG
jgi:hypothetical protein